MKALDGQMFRRDLQDVADSDYEHSVAAVKSRIAQTKADIARDAAAGTERLRGTVSAFLNRGGKQ
jgi:hypothetical protein